MWKRVAVVASVAVVGTGLVPIPSATAAEVVNIGTIQGQMAGHTGATTGGGSNNSDTNNCIRFDPPLTPPNPAVSSTLVSNPNEAATSHGRPTSGASNGVCPPTLLKVIPGGQSAIGITPSGLTTATTGTQFLLGTMRHYNNPIQVGEPNTGGGSRFVGNLNLRLLNTTFTFPYELLETPNGCSGANCADDILTFTSQIAGEVTIGNFKFRLVSNGFTQGQAAACPAQPVGSVVNRFQTVEGTTTPGCLYGELTQVRTLQVVKQATDSGAAPATVPPFQFTSTSSLAGSPWNVSDTLTPTSTTAPSNTASTARRTLLAGETVTITEAGPPTDWALTSVVCMDGTGASVPFTRNGGRIDLTASEVPQTAPAAALDITCTYTNTYRPPGLTVQKVFNPPAGLVLPANFTFRIPVNCTGTAFDRTVVFDRTEILAGNLTETIANVPTGTVCTFDETAPAVIPGWTWGTPPTFFPTTKSVTIVSNPSSRQNLAEVTNTISRDQGFLKIEKVFNPLASGFTGTFAVVYNCGAGNQTVNLAAGASTTVGPFPTETSCTVTEPVLPNAPTGWSFGTPSIVGSPAVIVKSTQQAPGSTATVTNTISRDQGFLKIEKVFNPLTSGFTGTFAVVYNCGAGNQTVNLAAGASTTVGPFPTETSCTVTEPVLPNAPTGWSFGTPSIVGSPAVIVKSTQQAPGSTATVTNTISRDQGFLKIEKVFNPLTSGFTGTFAVVYNCGAGNQTVNLAAGASTTVGPFPTETSCTVTEPVLPNAPTGWSFGTPSIVGSPAVIVKSTQQAPGSTATVTNTISRDTALLTLVKVVEGGSADATDWTLFADGPTPISGESGSKDVSEVVVDTGTYTMGEKDGPANYTPSDWVCLPDEVRLAALDSDSSLNDGDSLSLGKGDRVVCTIVNTRNTAQLQLQKAWINARGGDTAALTIKGGLPESGAPNKTSTATGATGTVLDTINVANATVQVGDTVTVTEVLGASNAGKYGSTLACTAGDTKVKVDDKGNFTMPDAAVTCTFTNDRSVVVPTQPTVTAEICDPNVPGAQLPGSITIPANPDYAYFIEGVATAAGTYPKPAGSYKVVAQLIVTKPVSASALQQLAAQDVYTWTVVVPGSPVCPLLVKESSAGTGSVITGQTVGYTITAKNGGDTAVVGETLVDALPAGVELITSSINPNTGVYNATARTITWKFDLPAAVGTTPATATFTYQVTVTASSGSIVNSVSWVERSLTATTSNTVTPGTVGGVEETPDEPDNVVGGSEDLPPTGADNTVNVAGFGLLAMVLGGLMVGFGRRRRRE